VTFVSAGLQWTLRALVLLCTGSAVALSIAFEFVREPVWWIELARYAPYPVSVAPALVIAALSWRMGRLWRIAALTGLMLLVTVVMGLRVHPGDTGQSRLRVMSYNAKLDQMWARPAMYTRLAAEVARHDPDILVLQDAFVDDGLRQVVPPARAIVGNRNLFAWGQYVIASRHPLKDCRPVGLEMPGRRNHALRCTVTVAGMEIDLVTVHLVSPREGLNATRRERLDGVDEWRENFAERLGQARALARAVQGSTRPLIVAGDLNAMEGSPVVRSLKDAGLRDAFSAAGVGYGYTHGHSLRPGFSFLRIDHILVSPAIGVADCFVGSSEASEHRPVIADLLLVRDP
jgi:vancomycin resistance protein VanJ